MCELIVRLAFKGWTFKSPHAHADKRYGHMAYISSGGQSGGASEDDAGSASSGETIGRRRIMDGDVLFGHARPDGSDADADAGPGAGAGYMAENGEGRATVRIRGGTVRGRALSL